jgi:hypothetical protein
MTVRLLALGLVALLVSGVAFLLWRANAPQILSPTVELPRITVGDIAENWVIRAFLLAICSAIRGVGAHVSISAALRLAI